MNTKLPTEFTFGREWLRRIAVKVNQILDGKTNNTGSVTLTASAPSTTVSDTRIGVDSVVGFMALTANAASELAAGGMYVSAIDPLTNTFTITHANASTTDREFRYSVIG